MGVENEQYSFDLGVTSIRSVIYITPQLDSGAGAQIEVIRDSERLLCC